MLKPNGHRLGGRLDHSAASTVALNSAKTSSTSSFMTVSLPTPSHLMAFTMMSVRSILRYSTRFSPSNFRQLYPSVGNVFAGGAVLP